MASESYYLHDKDMLAAIPPQGFLRDYVDWGMATNDAPAAFHVAMGLALLSMACPAMMYIPSFGRRTYGNMYVLVVGDSGSRKSTALDMAVDLYREMQPNAIGQQLGSYEGLVALLNATPKALVPESEMSRFFKQARGDGFLASLKYGYMEAYDAVGMSRRTSKVNLTGRQDLRLTLCGAIATHLLEDNVDPTDLTGGFLSRFVIAVGERTHTKVNMVDTQGLRERLKVHLKHVEATAFSCELLMSPEAVAVHADWIRQTDPLLSNRRNRRTTSFWERAGAMARKIALLLALDEHAQRYPWGVTWAQDAERYGMPKRIEVSGQAFVFATKLAGLYLNSQAAFAEDLAVTAPGKSRKRVLSAIPHPDDSSIGVALGTITRATEMDNSMALKWLATLEDQGLIEKIMWGGSGPVGQRVTYLRTVNVPGEDPAMRALFPEGIPTERPTPSVILGGPVQADGNRPGEYTGYVPPVQTPTPAGVQAPFVVPPAPPPPIWPEDGHLPR